MTTKPREFKIPTRLRTGYTLMLRTCDAEMKAHGACEAKGGHGEGRCFTWPRTGPVECSDWDSAKVCGNGLHGFLRGVGAARLASWAEDAVWLVVEIRVSEIVDLGDKIKVPRGRVLFAGDRGAALALMAKLGHLDAGHFCERVDEAGDQGTASATGYRGTASATGTQGTASATGTQGTASATGTQGTASATGTQGTASATGDQGTASATGYRGTASATGTQGTASATGTQGTASATGDQGTASATGTQGTASATGDQGTASATGYRGTASATGTQGTASATGTRGTASATGDQGTASATGDQGTASATGEHSLAVATHEAEVGELGTLIFRVWDDSAKRWRARVFYAGEDGVEAGTRYQLSSDGVLVRVEKPAPPAAEATAQ